MGAFIRSSLRFTLQNGPRGRYRTGALGLGMGTGAGVGLSSATTQYPHWLPFSTQSPSYRVRSPPDTAPIQRVIPLLFVSAQAWDPSSAEGQTSLSAMFAEQGYTCIEVDLSAPKIGPKASGGEILDALATDLGQQIRLSGHTFRPCLVSRSVGGSLIAQRYVESNPLSGLIMIAPGASTKSPPAKALLPNDVEEFSYEPHFPILLVDTPQRFKDVHAKEKNRLLEIDNGEAVDKLAVEDLGGQKAFVGIARWLDEMGL